MSSRERLAASVVVCALFKKKTMKRKNRLWVRNWISKREYEGVHAKLLQELCSEDSEAYQNFLRMSKNDYDYILAKITPRISKKDTHLRKSISASERLTLTLRFMATGDSFHSLSFLFRIPPSTISKIIPEVCQAVYEEFHDKYLKMPSTADEWEKEAEFFKDLWHFPNCIGSIDGKHVVMKTPANSGSLYFNYKGTHSIVLMALVNAKYKFLYVDVGCNGRISDGGIFANCTLSKYLENKSFNLPQPQKLCGQSEATPFVILADDAFPWKTNIMKPFPFKNQPVENRVYNYRISRARRVVENAFGLLSAKFRALRKPFELEPHKVTAIVLSMCVLHNLLLSRHSSMKIYAPPDTFDREEQGRLVPGSWREEGDAQGTFLPLQTTNVRNPPLAAKGVRERFKQYFMCREGEVSWQYQKV